MNQKIIVVLGSFNSSEGELGVVAKDRLNKCLDLFREGFFVVCTGGWGDHFNVSSKPHAFYARKYLIKNGISESNFLANLLSKNTVDDAVKIKEFLSKLSGYDLTIITSDFHLERVQLIFGKILKKYNFNCIGAKSSIEKKELKVFISHEKKAIRSILKNGLYY